MRWDMLAPGLWSARCSNLDAMGGTRPGGDVSGDEYVRALVEESPDALIAVSPEGTVLFWNRGAATMFGYATDEAVGRTLAELIIPDDRAAEARASLDEALRA